MSTNTTPLERYRGFLVPHVPGRPKCFGWRGKIDKYGNASFTWTEDGTKHSGNAARWLWQHHRGPLGPDETLSNTCGWPACQRLGHWKVIERPRGLTPAERYERGVDRSGGPEACHLWTRGTDKDGYGLLTWREGKKTVTRRAHRFGWGLVFGEIPEDHVVCHTCDNPPCQNQNHWFLGTVKDNNDDKRAKGRERYRSGEKHYRAVLTDDQVREVRVRFTGEYGQISALAREYGIKSHAMGKILRDEVRRDVR